MGLLNIPKGFLNGLLFDTHDSVDLEVVELTTQVTALNK